MARQRSRYELEQRIRELEKFKLFVPIDRRARDQNAYTPGALQEAFDEYFRDCPNEQLTITGLALSIGSRQLLYDYEKRPEYAHIVKEARLKIENAYELNLRRFGRTGDIFALKQFGWKDDREVVVQPGAGGNNQITINVQLVQPQALPPGQSQGAIDVGCQETGQPQITDAPQNEEAETETAAAGIDDPGKITDFECEG